jgi:hypothetical protein
MRSAALSVMIIGRPMLYAPLGARLVAGVLEYSSNRAI